MKHLLLVALLLGCSSPSRPPPPTPIVAETPPTTHDPGAVVDDQHLQPTQRRPEPTTYEHNIAPRADGQPCLAASECQSGVCEGEGCGAGTPGTCAAKSRSCTRDLRPYCGCDGKTFRTSGSCPGQRFASHGECTPP